MSKLCCAGGFFRRRVIRVRLPHNGCGGGVTVAVRLTLSQLGDRTTRVDDCRDANLFLGAYEVSSHTDIGVRAEPSRGWLVVSVLELSLQGPPGSSAVFAEQPEAQRLRPGESEPRPASQPDCRWFLVRLRSCLMTVSPTAAVRCALPNSTVCNQVLVTLPRSGSSRVIDTQTSQLRGRAPLGVCSYLHERSVGCERHAARPLLVPAAHGGQRRRLDNALTRLRGGPWRSRRSMTAPCSRRSELQAWVSYPRPKPVAEEVLRLYGLAELGRLEVGKVLRGDPRETTKTSCCRRMLKAEAFMSLARL